MISDIAPFKMAGNLYFVGTYKASSHLLVTSEGLVLIDTGYDYNAESIKEGIEALGFDIKDVKHILHSHGHYDHTDATAELVKLTGAKTYLGKEVADMILKYDLGAKTIVTGGIENLKDVRAHAPILRTGCLTRDVDDALLAQLLKLGIEGVYPMAKNLSPERVKQWHRMGFDVRGWATMGDPEVIRNMYDIGTDGLTINHPEILFEYIKSKNAEA